MIINYYLIYIEERDVKQRFCHYEKYWPYITFIIYRNCISFVNHSYILLYNAKGRFLLMMARKCQRLVT